MKFIFVNDTELELSHIDESAAAHVVGMTNQFGGVHLVAHEKSCNMFYPLTFCCLASGKGWGDDISEEPMVVCRSCFQEVEWVMGDIVEPENVVRLATKEDYVLA